MGKKVVIILVFFFLASVGFTQEKIRSTLPPLESKSKSKLAVFPFKSKNLEIAKLADNYLLTHLIKRKLFVIVDKEVVKSQAARLDIKEFTRDNIVKIALELTAQKAILGEIVSITEEKKDKDGNKITVTKYTITLQSIDTSTGNVEAIETDTCYSQESISFTIGSLVRALYPTEAELTRKALTEYLEPYMNANGRLTYTAGGLIGGWAMGYLIGGVYSLFNLRNPFTGARSGGTIGGLLGGIVGYVSGYKVDQGKAIIKVLPHEVEKIKQKSKVFRGSAIGKLACWMGISTGCLGGGAVGFIYAIGELMKMGFSDSKSIREHWHEAPEAWLKITLGGMAIGGIVGYLYGRSVDKYSAMVKVYYRDYGYLVKDKDTTWQLELKPELRIEPIKVPFSNRVVLQYKVKLVRILF